MTAARCQQVMLLLSKCFFLSITKAPLLKGLGDESVDQAILLSAKVGKSRATSAAFQQLKKDNGTLFLQYINAFAR